MVKFTWKMRTLLNRKKNLISDFSDFYFFELWLIVFTIIYGDTPNESPTRKEVVQKWPNLQERCATGWNGWKVNFAILSFFLDMVDFALKFRKKYMLWVPPPQTHRLCGPHLPPFAPHAPEAFGLNPPSQLVFGG